ncbi:MAG: GIY-YIG nuclease family protein [Candidatus Zixiibacteriota bacterium]
MPRTSFVYILTNNNNTVLYTGITGNLPKRIAEHKRGIGSAFTRKYKLTKLVYFEVFEDITYAIAREKQIKKGSRLKKIDLVNSINPEWEDLSDGL